MLSGKEDKSDESRFQQQSLTWAVIFFIIAIVANLLGFRGVASGAAQIAKILFLVLFIIALITGLAATA